MSPNYLITTSPFHSTGACPSPVRDPSTITRMGRDQEEASDREAQSSVGEYSPDFIEPSCSWESVEDASSSPPRSFASLLSRLNSASRLDPPASPLNNGDGPPYELSDLMAHLPIKWVMEKPLTGISWSYWLVFSGGNSCFHVEGDY